MELAGTVHQGDKGYAFDFSVDNRGQLMGGINVSEEGASLASLPVPVLARKTRGGQLFLSSQQWFQQEGLYTGARWVSGERSDLSRLFDKLDDLSGLARTVEAGTSSVVESDGVPTADGKATLKLRGKDVTVTALKGGNLAPVRIESETGAVLNNQLKDLKLDLRNYDRALAVSIPGPYVDLNNLNTLPTHLQPVNGSFSFDNCDRGGCSMSAGVMNAGGRDGTAWLTFHIRLQSTDVGSCTATVPPLDHNGTTRVGCKAMFANVGTATIQGTADITNPVV